MSYVGTTEAARQINVSPRTLRRWLARKLVPEPRVRSINTIGGGARGGVMVIRMFGQLEVEALRKFKARYRARKRPRLDPVVKAARKKIRQEIRNAERLLHTAEWFEKHPLCERIFIPWTRAQTLLAGAGLLTPDGKLAPNALEGLETRLSDLKTEHAAGPKKLPIRQLETIKNTR